METVSTPVGDARVHVAAARRPRATLVLGHGAGGGIEAVDLAALADAGPRIGFSVVRVESPWRVAGRKVATPPPTLDAAWCAVLAHLAPQGPVVVGGRSAGARVAARTATAVGADACLALAFPLHPPGRPGLSRLPELTAAGVPTVVVQGGRDAFGGPGEFPAHEAYAVREVPYADHSFRVPRSAPLTQGEAVGLVVSHVAAWLRRLVG
jgi:uncharacterized protein